MSLRLLVVSAGVAGVLLAAPLVGVAAAQTPSPPPAAQAPPPPPPLVKVGQPMPDFTLPYLEPAPDGGRPQSRTVTLSSLRGKQAVVLAFYPAAFSPG
jgi:peroxiredoxin Q/BCP